MTQYDIEHFLVICKIAANNLVIFDFDDQDYQTISSLGYELADVVSEIMSLSIRDYLKGPRADDKGYGGDIWEFGKLIQGQEIYIKVKVKNLNFEGDRELNCLCLSFHRAKYPFVFPYKQT